MKTAVLVLAVLLLSGCGSKIDGTYCNSSGIVKVCYTFKSNGTVLMSSKGAYGFGAYEAEMKYKVDGDKIKIGVSQAGASMVLTMLKDGSIQGGPLGIMTRQKK